MFSTPDIFRPAAATGAQRRAPVSGHGAAWRVGPGRGVLVRATSTHAAGHGTGDDEWLRGQMQVLDTVRRGLRDPTTRALATSYGPGVNMVFDFAQRRVVGDARALHQLCSQGELPQPAEGARPEAGAGTQGLDDIAWAVGLAGGGLPLADAPADAWHVPLLWLGGSNSAYTPPEPRYREALHLLRQEALSPLALRRRARLGLTDLRRLLQACLLMRLVHWVPDAGEQGAN